MRLLTLISLFIISLSYSQKNEQEKLVTCDFAGQIKDAKLAFIKNQYNWTEDILIINYSQPLSICHFDNNTITSSTKSWWKRFYSKIDIKECKNIKVLYNGEKVKKKLDNVAYFDDYANFLYLNYFSRKESCYGILVVNKNGHYLQYNGHYSEKQVSKFIDNLKNIL